MSIFSVADLREHPTESILARVPGTSFFTRYLETFGTDTHH